MLGYHSLFIQGSFVCSEKHRSSRSLRGGAEVDPVQRCYRPSSLDFRTQEGLPRRRSESCQGFGCGFQRTGSMDFRCITGPVSECEMLRLGYNVESCLTNNRYGRSGLQKMIVVDFKLYSLHRLSRPRCLGCAQMPIADTDKHRTCIVIAPSTPEKRIQESQTTSIFLFWANPRFLQRCYIYHSPKTPKKLQESLLRVFCHRKIAEYGRWLIT